MEINRILDNVYQICRWVNDLKCFDRDHSAIKANIHYCLFELVISVHNTQSFLELLNVLQEGFIELKESLQDVIYLENDYQFFINSINFQMIKLMEKEIFPIFGHQVPCLDVISFISACRYLMKILDKKYIQNYLFEVFPILLSQTTNPILKRKLQNFKSIIEEDSFSAEDLELFESIYIKKSELQQKFYFDQESILNQEAQQEVFKTLEYKDLEFLGDSGSERILNSNTHENSENTLEIKISQVEVSKPFQSSWIKKEYITGSYQNLLMTGKSELEILELISKGKFKENFLIVVFPEKNPTKEKIRDCENSQKKTVYRLMFLTEKCDLELSSVSEYLAEYAEEDLLKEIVFSLKSQLFMLHEMGVIHNDLSFNNVMIKNRKSYLVDFNCSFQVNAKGKSLINANKIGNQEFWPPELVLAYQKKWLKIQIDYQKVEVFSFSLFLMKLFEKFFNEDILEIWNWIHKEFTGIERPDEINDFFNKVSVKSLEKTVRRSVKSSSIYGWAKVMILKGLYLNPDKRGYLEC